MKRNILLAITLCIAALSGAAQAGMPFSDTMTGVFDEKIKSLRISLDGNDFAPHVVVLGSADRIRVEFDQLAEDREYFRYSLTHCNANWQPSGLTDSEFLTGFNEGTVEDYDFSRATTVHYVHYSLTIPNEQIAPTISGNYLLKIYNENDPDKTLLQCRFMVSEETAPVAADVSPRTDIDFNQSHQQLTIAVETERAQVRDPFNDLFIAVSQNGRLDNEAFLRQPLRVSGTRAFYEQQPQLIFDAGNEYRRMETVSTSYPGMGVEDIVYAKPYYHFKLFTDETRAGQQYLFDSTQHGRYFIREYDSDESDVDADYGVVHFSLDYPETPGTMIFLDGDFVHRRFDPNSQMVYNPATGLYERSMLLKQGAYNYQYLAVPPKARSGKTSYIEGDKFQTVNEYLIKVYHRRQGERYDRLIGVGTTVSDH